MGQCDGHHPHRSPSRRPQRARSGRTSPRCRRRHPNTQPLSRSTRPGPRRQPRQTRPLGTTARSLIRRFHRYEDMILRFATDLAVPFTNNEAERAVRPVKIQQRTSGGCWRTLQGLTDFALVQSYLDTATKWGLNKLDALRKLFTTGPWLPPALTPAE
ncbi:IS66 family transposase [Saccharopolyspora hattusasensis]|uniref:IS66 family transposase n=1 Tax=Saccharopolyspora hattusasensis TaxID=1128679 RepID=UPI003D97D77E